MRDINDMTNDNKKRCKRCDIILNQARPDTRESTRTKNHCLDCATRKNRRPIAWVSKTRKIVPPSVGRKAYTSQLGVFKKGQFSADIINYMEAKGIVPQEFSLISKVNATSIRKFMNGKVKAPYMSTVQRVADILRTDAQSYFEGKR